jgi:hypothetical protein
VAAAGRRAGCEVWVKHENHTPTGAFKVRGGLNLMAELVAARAPAREGACQRDPRQPRPEPRLSPALRHGVRVTDRGALRQQPRQERRDARFGAELIVHGRDFDEAREHAAAPRPGSEKLRFVGPFEPELVAGVATYALELLPGGAGPAYGIRADRLRFGHLRPHRRARCAGTRDADRRRVVAATANAYAQSFEASASGSRPRRP